MALGLAGCPDDPPSGLEGTYGFSAVVFVQRPAASHTGPLAGPDALVSGGRLVMLDPAAPGGKLTALIDPPAGDVLGLDVSADGRRVLAGVRLSPSDRYHLIEVDLDAVAAGQDCLTADLDLGPACSQLTFGPADDTRPFYLPDGRVAFNRADPDGQMDVRGRGRARQLYAVQADGSDLRPIDFGPGQVLGASGIGDGAIYAVRATERDGRERFLPVRIDPAGAAGLVPDGPLAGDEGLPLSVVRGLPGGQLAACTPPLGTWTAGTICQQQGGDRAAYQGIVNGIPTGSGCSPEGRLRDPTPLGQDQYLVSYAKVADGCVTIEDGDRGRRPDFGLAILDAETGERFPLFNTPDLDELMVAPLRSRSLLDAGTTLPARPDQGCAGDGVLIEGFVGREAQAAGLVGLRVLHLLDGGVAPSTVELGAAQAGAICLSPDGGSSIAPVLDDGSFSLRVPALAPLRVQGVDRYGAAVQADPLWRGGPGCARRTCSGCHDNDGELQGFGASLASAAGPVDLSRPADQLSGFDFSRDIQPILDRSCATSGCHDSETAAGAYVDLNGSLRGLDLHAAVSGRRSVAYDALLWLDTRRSAQDGHVLEQRHPYVVPGRARESRLIQRLGVPCRFDCADALPWAPWAMGENRRHPEDQSGASASLTDEERWLLVEWIDAGAPFAGREAKP